MISHQQYGAGNPNVRGNLPNPVQQVQHQQQVNQQQHLPQQQQQQPPPPQPDNSISATDFNFDLLDGDAGNFSAQDLLNSFDSTNGFNLDIL